MTDRLEPTQRADEINARFLAERQDLAERLLASGADGIEDAGRLLTAATDAWVADVWREAGGAGRASLFALGGYGRRELALGSDVDLAFHSAPEDLADPDFVGAVERFVAWVRPTRVKVSHVVRTPDQMLDALREDYRSAVAYLDMRPVGGERLASAPQALELLRGDDEGLTFVRRLLDGYRHRLDRFGQTIFLLEPDVKSGKGGLRDLHLVRWAALVRGGFDPAVEIDPPWGWNPADRERYRESNTWLLRVRSLLHAHHGRKHDRLNFGDQEMLAPRLVPGDVVGNIVEALMRGHYRVARTAAKLAERSLRRWSREGDAEVDVVQGAFRLAGGQLGLVGEADVEDVFGALRVASQHDALLDPEAEERIEAAVEGWGDRALGTDVGERLRTLLTSRDTSFRTSTRLAELGVLTAVVPEFEPVVCHVQHDVYHVYTTDVHLLLCLEFARSLLNGGGPGHDRWPTFGTIASEIEDTDVFLLAALFHDIGKNRGGGHSEKGAVIMGDVGPRLGLDPSQTSLLGFLVREHLTLSHVSRRHDLADRRIVRDLAARIRTVEALNQLTALTFCDMSTVAPNVMNDWNATLLLQLHHMLRDAIEHGVEEAWRRVERQAGEVLEWLQERLGDDAATQNRIDAFVRDLPALHLVEASRESLLSQFDAYARASGNTPIVVVRPDPDRASTEVVVSSADTPGALAQITGTISSLGLNILDARIVTTASGRLLDIFRVAQSGGAAHALTNAEQQAVTDEARLQRLQEALESVLSGASSAEELLRKRIAQSRLPPRATPRVDTDVEVMDEISEEYTVLQIRAPDRIGLLYDIAGVLTRSGVDIRLSRIDSVGTQVVDTFYVEEDGGGPLDATRTAEITRSLLEVLRQSPLHE